MRQLFDAQKAALLSEMPVTSSSRHARLDRASAMIEQHAEALCEAVSRDHGHSSPATVMVTEIAPALAALDGARRNLDRWMRGGGGSRLKRMVRPHVDVDHQPRGVIGVVVPPTLPLGQSIGLLATIFAAGNRVMMKFDHATPYIAALLRDIGPKYFDPAEVAFLAGGAEADAVFGQLPFDFVMADSAATDIAGQTIPTGKSPVIVGRSVDLAKVADRLVAAKMVQSGQVPLAPDYLLVPDELQDEMASWLYRSVAARHPDILADPDYAPILDDDHYARLTALIDDARRKGGDVLVVEQDRGTPDVGSRLKLPLHIVKHATADMLLMQEEVFGPVLPIRGYRTLDEAIAEINRGAPPLLVHYHGRDAAERHHVIERVMCCAIAVNGAAPKFSNDAVSVAGQGAMLDQYAGEPGFLALSRTRRIYHQPTIALKQFALSPLGDERAAGAR